MDKNKVIVEFKITNRSYRADIEIPLDITANELVYALNSAYKLGIDVDNVKNSYLKAENPIVLLKGNKTLAEFGVRSGTVILFTE